MPTATFLSVIGHARDAVRHVPALPRALALGLALSALGCAPDESVPRPSVEHPADAPPAAAAVPAPALAPWYVRSRTLDLTGDGRVDSVRLVARGTRPDSLRVALSFLVDGEEKHREEWGSGYELALADPADRQAPRVDAILRAALDSVLGSVVAHRLDAPGAHLMAEDSAALAALEPRPTHGVRFAYGYETTVRLAWDAPRRRFVRLWSCC